VNGHRKEPNERKPPELTPEDWEAIVAWRPYLYQMIRAFGAKVLGTRVWLTGNVEKNTHRWITGEATAYGIDARAALEDMEASAFEAAAVAAHKFDPTKGYQFSTYLTRVVEHGLQKAFDAWVLTSTSKHEDGVRQWSAMQRLYEPDGPTDDSRDRHGQSVGEDWDPQYEKTAYPHDALPEPSALTPEDEARLENAMGGLTSKEAWALRMYADGAPADAIADALGYKGEKSVYKLIAKAKDKARVAAERDLP
jgi:DNA-directed RNA polymerase specialized sigma24 family protein